ncbi:hypothetical protein ANCCAN_06082 [Ancylostoma caninum]|uniref:Uncharacterized protein n=1 Tax=Ancylostoma caninum TaxID=29170 RepID=A0A368GWD5_ANCCA|nr:hypothetical protein ANCCAN_06082 [Ancylostoma caninum]
MESECPTPYNSLYVPMKRAGLVCCKHGIACEVAKKEKERGLNGEDTSEQYVNLVDTKKDATKSRDELIQSLAGKLRYVCDRVVTVFKCACYSSSKHLIERGELLHVK